MLLQNSNFQMVHLGFSIQHGQYHSLNVLLSIQHHTSHFHAWYGFWNYQSDHGNSELRYINQSDNLLLGPMWVSFQYQWTCGLAIYDSQIRKLHNTDYFCSWRLQLLDLYLTLDIFLCHKAKALCVLCSMQILLFWALQFTQGVLHQQRLSMWLLVVK